ncbi:MAG TPA: alpha-mannosidase, partial [Acidimicrobiia bacterium]|nr:alpha-mannosidase [Acidimicrobiia bacterium]
MITDETVQRAREVLLGVVEPAVFGPGQALTITAHHLHGEPVSPAEALRRPYGPFAVGDAWGPRWGTTWFRLQGRIPPDWAGEEVVLRLEATRVGTAVPGGEFLIFSTAGGIAAPILGLSSQHAAASLPWAALAAIVGGTPPIPRASGAAGGEEVDLHVEAAANPTTPEDRMVGYDWPELRPDPGGVPGFILSRCELAVRRPAVRALALDLGLAIGLAAQLPAGAEQAAEARTAVASAVAAIDPGDVPGSAVAARAALGPLLAARGAGPTNGSARVTAVGHAHIDTAWLWPLRETVRKCARTFATAVALMDEFPEYRFVCSAAQHLVWMEEHYPELFARITERVRTGQFVPVGGMWVEADCNLASGEALVRQLVLGQRYFADRFGTDCREAWLPDAFGYTAALPQIMAAAGIDWFVSQKLSWNETNPFPHHTFWW